MSVFNRDGSVISSSQLEYNAWLADRSVGIMLGIILDVKPSDSRDNYTALNYEDYRGYRHECSVLAADYLGKQPDVLITNVIIPPFGHSGVDNYAEDLPRGCSSMIDGSEYKEDFSKVDYTKLDGEWCLVGFIGGNIENAVIIGWWPHPSNTFDPATTGFGNEESTLVQFDLDKNRSRFIRRINGTQIALNRQGSVYLDTSEANSSVKIVDGKVVRTLVDKGGDIQIDLSPKAQFEINFNAKEHRNPRIGAGSTSANPVTDPDLLHNDQPVVGSPKARETSRTFIRGKEYELLFKTSNLSVFCEANGGEDGEYIVQATDGVTIAQQESGGTAAVISIRDGNIQVVGADGTQFNVLDDEVLVATKSGGLLDLKAAIMAIAAQVNISGPLAVGGAVGAEPGIKGTSFLGLLVAYLTSEAAMANTTYLQYQALDAATKVPPLTPLNPPFAALATAWQSYATAVNTFLASVSLPPGTNPSLTLNLTST